MTVFLCRVYQSVNKSVIYTFQRRKKPTPLFKRVSDKSIEFSQSTFFWICIRAEIKICGDENVKICGDENVRR